MKIFYQRAYYIAPFLQEKIGFEMEIPDDGHPLEEIQTLKDLCDEANKKLNPHLYTESGKPITIEQVREEEPLDKRIASLIEDINKCTAINYVNSYGVQEGLIAYEDMVAGHPELQAAYDLKLKQL